MAATPTASPFVIQDSLAATQFAVGTTGLITTPSVNSGSIVDGTIATADISAAGLGTAALANDAVTSAKILDGTIATADISAAGLGTAALANDAVTSAKILDGTIASADIADGTIAGADLASTIAISTSGNISTTGTLTVGTGGTPITKHLAFGPTVVDILNIATAGTCTSTAVTATGVAAGDPVYASPTPIAGGIETLAASWSVFASAANAITIRACAHAANQDPAAQNWKLVVEQH